MTDRSGIEIDYCPDCRGVWLDRGELDKIIDRSTQSFKHVQNGSSFDKPKYTSEKEYKYKNKKGLLGELFDF